MRATALFVPVGWALAALALSGCGEDAASSSAPSGSSGSSVSAGAGGNGGAGGGGGADLGPCLPASEPFGTDPSAGESFGDVKLTSCDGQSHYLDEIRCQNAITLISIGAGWCGPCKEEAPVLEAASKTLAGQGIGIIQVLFEDGQSNPATTLFCEAWTSELALTIPVYVDPPANTLTFFDAPAAPLNVVVDHDGKVLWAASGLFPEDIVGLLQSLLPN
jgi:thiol-disulfide isomerase/thioredoxin